jgi:hypothetical protein
MPPSVVIAAEPTTHVLKVLDPRNPRQITWETGDGHVARAEFNRLLIEGSVLYQVDEKTGQREQLHAFNPEATVIEARVQLVGG